MNDVTEKLNKVIDKEINKRISKKKNQKQREFEFKMTKEYLKMMTMATAPKDKKDLRDKIEKAISRKDLLVEKVENLKKLSEHCNAIYYNLKLKTPRAEKFKRASLNLEVGIKLFENMMNHRDLLENQMSITRLETDAMLGIVSNIIPCFLNEMSPEQQEAVFEDFKQIIKGKWTIEAIEKVEGEKLDEDIKNIEEEVEKQQEYSLKEALAEIEKFEAKLKGKPTKNNAKK